ncbi:hypothetical protein CERZMDRAFT_92878 [Cercospora zeae-maydis SCOH1-5]|uniref:Protein kinase domain-containing protein n=1 Tax=Cercospora zeae-maydis SCOH1-5 TaxID=717836 RepID=A0A6A6FTJ5_9PEZI|nr:hypothetical protein CERZMDRAFT_92878 [Cercospora zeae-maydis SCOH1-5]
MSIIPIQGIGDGNAQGSDPRDEYLRSWHHAAGRLRSGGMDLDAIDDLYNRMQKMASEHNVYLQFSELSGITGDTNYRIELLTSVRKLEDQCWRRSWADSAKHVRDLGWNRAADAIEALGASVVMNGRHTRDITALDKCNALYSDVEHRLSIRNVDNRTLDRYRGQKERLIWDLTNHGTFVMPPDFPTGVSAQQFCENLMMAINQSRVNRVKPSWDAASAALQERFRKMTEFVTANYDPYFADQHEPERRPPLAIPFDDANQTVFFDAGGKWHQVGYIGGGATANVLLWYKVNPWNMIVDRVAGKEMYLEPENQWLSPEYWEVPIHDRIPREYALARSLNDLNVENAVRHRDYGLYEKYVMIRLYLEVCEFGDLNKAIREHFRFRQRISTRAIWSVFEALATVLVFMERGNTPAGVTPPQHRSQYHRDIKPENVFFTAPNARAWQQLPTAKLGDFGLGTWTTAGNAHAPGIGTPEYMAPEALACGRPDDQQTTGGHQSYHTVTTKSDVWSVGRVIMAMMQLEGDPVWLPLFKCTEQEPSFDQQSQTQYPLPLQNLVLQCLKDDPAQRPTPSGLWTEIQNATHGLKHAQPSDQEPPFMNFVRPIYAGMAL